MLDYLIRGAHIVDGTGTPGFQGDVGILGDKIAAVGRLPEAAAAREVDGRGYLLTPGFIDIHRHGDGALFRPGFGLPELAQGITTMVNGNCGMSLAPVSGRFCREVLDYLSPVTGPLPEGRAFPTMAAYLDQSRAQPKALHAGMLVGMGTLRGTVAGLRPGPLSQGEERAVRRGMEEAISQGALGVSLGLGYAPECFYDTQGLIRVLSPLRGSGVPITVHLRQEGDGVVEALEEMLTVARALDTPVEISHLKGIGQRNWGRAVPRMLELLDRARQEGVDVACDLYPYAAGSTQLIHVLPPEVQGGGLEGLTALLRDPARRQAIRRRMETGRDFENIIALVGFDHVRVTSLHEPQDLPLEGKTVEEIARAEGKDPYDALFDLLIQEHCAPSMIDVIASEGDMEEILRRPYSSVISDATYPQGGLIHPRVYGSCARLLERYVRKRRVLSLEAAVHKITGLPASRLRLGGKGKIAPGMDADLCLFRLEEIRERGTWDRPRQLAEGMAWVFVSGQPALREGRFTGLMAGRNL